MLPGTLPTTAHGPRQFRIRRAAAAQPVAAPALESPGPPRPSVPGPGGGGPVSHCYARLECNGPGCLGLTAGETGRVRLVSK